MSKKLIVFAAILSLVFMRMIIPIPNFTPIGAIALFGGAMFGLSAWALAIPFAALLLSDTALGFHDTMPFVYGAFLITILIGSRLRNKVSIKNLVGASLVSSTLFFLVTNFGSWMLSGLYPMNAAGLLASYAAGLAFYTNDLFGSFFLNEVMGGLFFNAVLFGSYYFVAERNTAKSLS